MPLTDLNLRRNYDPETCPDPVTEFYAPALAQAIAYDRANGNRADTRLSLQNLTGEIRFDLDFLTNSLENAAPVAAAITMADLPRALTAPGLLPAGWQAIPTGGNHWRLPRPDDAGQQEATTDRDAYEYGGGDLAWFGPGSPWWPG